MVSGTLNVELLEDTMCRGERGAQHAHLLRGRARAGVRSRVRERAPRAHLVRGRGRAGVRSRVRDRAPRAHRRLALGGVVRGVGAGHGVPQVEPLERVA